MVVYSDADFKDFGPTSKYIRKSALLYLHNHLKEIDLRLLKKMNPLISVDIVLVNQPGKQNRIQQSLPVSPSLSSINPL